MWWYHLCSSCREQEVSSDPKVRVAASLLRNITSCSCSQRDPTLAENQLYEVLFLKHFSPCQAYFGCKVEKDFPPEAITEQHSKTFHLQEQKKPSKNPNIPYLSPPSASTSVINIFSVPKGMQVWPWFSPQMFLTGPGDISDLSLYSGCLWRVSPHAVKCTQGPGSTDTLKIPPQRCS